jgi:4-amino-4-deoxy-L-arabinose transferase-like glycosyltransferase
MTALRPAALTWDEIETLLPETQPDFLAEDWGQQHGDPELKQWWQQRGRPSWSVPARFSLFGLTAILYTWNLSHNGLGNTFYAASVRSGTESWKAFFFGSLDPKSFITIDKPPAAFWVMEISGRIFGFSSWSMLLPEALAGVATVMIVYNLVRRWFGEQAAVFASLALALTPVAVVIFRYNDPDAFLTLLLVSALWACWRAIETGRTAYLVLSGAFVGLAFLTKTLDAVIVVPPLALAYLFAGTPRLARRVGQLGWAAVALLVSSGWWVATVEIWPKNARPFIGGSTDNSELNLIFGYNGFSRVSGSDRSLLSDGGQGLFRMFNMSVGGQISWFLPLAIVGAFGIFCLTRGRDRTDRERAGLVMWGSVLLFYCAVYDDARGVFHPYYTAVMAPAVAALAGGGIVALWRLGRRSLRWAWVLPASIVGSVVWADALLARTSAYHPWLGPTVVLAGVAAALVLLLFMTRPLGSTARPLGTLWIPAAAALVAVAALVAGPSAYALTTIGNVTRPPATAGPQGGNDTLGWIASSDDIVHGGLVHYLERHQGSAVYLAAVTASPAAAQIIVSSGKPVVAMGGYMGWDPTPTLGAFKHLVARGMVRYAYVVRDLATRTATTAAVVKWIERYGAVVSPAAYGGGPESWSLYDMAAVAAPGTRILDPNS